MATAPPILIWQPAGGTPPGTTTPIEDVGNGVTAQGITQLVNAQSYIDVVFDIEQVDNTWIFVECSVLNTTDPDPLNIWPGIITVKTSTGFRLQLNGMPDSNNYFLNWAISGVNIPPPEPFPATTYTLIGPTTGTISTPSTAFTVKLPVGSTVASPVIVTPGDGGGGGTFIPATVTLTTAAPLATFTYTPASYGAKTISATNDGGLTDPGSVTYTCVASTYTFSGPSSGATGVASTNFTVALPVGGVVIGTVTVTPNSGGGGGTFTPSTVGLTTSAPSATFTYTPATDGTKTISVTNNGGLTNPANISYVASTVFSPGSIAGLKGWWKADSFALSDGATATAWTDQSSAGNNLTGTATFKTGIVGGKPVLRFNGSTNAFNKGSDIGVSQPLSLFVVAKAATLPCHWVHGGANTALGLTVTGAFFLYSNGTVVGDSIDSSAAFHVYSGIFSGGNGTAYRDGVNRFGPSSTGASGIGDMNLMTDYVSVFFAGDIAEVLLYNSALGTTDRTNVEAYLMDKYGL